MSEPSNTRRFTTDRFDHEHGDITLHVCDGGQTVCTVPETLFDDAAQAHWWARRIVRALERTSGDRRAGSRRTLVMDEGTKALEEARRKLSFLEDAAWWQVGTEQSHDSPIEALDQHVDSCAPFLGCGVDMAIGAAGIVEVTGIFESGEEQYVPLSAREVYEVLRAECPEHWITEDDVFFGDLSDDDQEAS